MLKIIQILGVCVAVYRQTNYEIDLYNKHIYVFYFKIVQRNIHDAIL
jgi:hypothetical protein